MVSRLLVDVGQTGTRLRIESDIAAPIEDAAAGVRPDHSPEEHLGQVAEQILTRHAARVDVVAAGLSGLHGGGADAGSVLARLAGFGVSRVVLADDSVTAYLAALGSTPGVVVAVGTGVVALAASGGADGAIARVDGWGHLLGDDGGGYWIGRAGLQAVMRALDGRGPSTVLLEAAKAEFGPPERIGLTLQRDPDRVRTIAAFAKNVLEHAEGGDRTAVGIRAAAAAELARTAHAAAQGARCDGERIPVSWSGSLLTAVPALCADIDHELARLDPRYTLTPPHGSQLDGTHVLAGLSTTHPLAALVRQAFADNEDA